MTLRLFIAALAAALVLTLALAGSAGSASAHERRVVATNYEFESGFFIEPAITNSLNGVFMSIVYFPDGAPETASEEEAEGGEPVLGADQTMKVTVIVGGGAATKELEFEGLEDPGSYVASFIPTLPGEYTFVITGTLNGTEINETFESGPNTFSSVEDAADYEFPQPTADSGDSSSSDADSEDDDDNTAMIVAGVAIVVALVAGGIGIYAASRSRSA
jgi:hypothetical protein